MESYLSHHHTQLYVSVLSHSEHYYKYQRTIHENLSEDMVKFISAFPLLSKRKQICKLTTEQRSIEIKQQFRIFGRGYIQGISIVF